MSNTPQNIFIQTINLCSAKCIFCPFNYGLPRPEVMPDPIFSHLVNSLSTIRFKRIIMGYNCDPFLDSIIFKRLDIIREYLPEELEIEISTNLMLLDQQKIFKLRNYRLEKINVMLFSYSPFVYTRLMPGNHYQTAFDNLEILAEVFKDSKTIINIVMPRHKAVHQNEIDALTKFADEHGLTLSLVDLPEKARFCTNSFQLYREDSLYIDATGCIVSSNLNNPRYIAGNIMDRDEYGQFIPLKDVINSEKYKIACENFRKDFNI
jgi:MoaA/NifB/PqqE/SkfB family radical SAM enzyme